MRGSSPRRSQAPSRHYRPLRECGDGRGRGRFEIRSPVSALPSRRRPWAGEGEGTPPGTPPEDTKARERNSSHRRRRAPRKHVAARPRRRTTRPAGQKQKKKKKPPLPRVSRLRSSDGVRALGYLVLRRELHAGDSWRSSRGDGGRATRDLCARFSGKPCSLAELGAIGAPFKLRFICAGPRLSLLISMDHAQIKVARNISSARATPMPSFGSRLAPEA